MFAAGGVFSGLHRLLLVGHDISQVFVNPQLLSKRWKCPLNAIFSVANFAARTYFGRGIGVIKTEAFGVDGARRMAEIAAQANCETACGSVIAARLLKH